MLVGCFVIEDNLFVSRQISSGDWTIGRGPYCVLAVVALDDVVALHLLDDIVQRLVPAYLNCPVPEPIEAFCDSLGEFE